MLAAKKTASYHEKVESINYKIGYNQITTYK